MFGQNCTFLSGHSSALLTYAENTFVQSVAIKTSLLTGTLVHQLLGNRILSPEYNPLEERWDDVMNLVTDLDTRRHFKHSVELLECELFCLGDKQEDQSQRNKVEDCISAERAGRGEGPKHSGKGQSKNRGETKTHRDRPCHALFPLRQGEDFGRVHEWDGAWGQLKC